MKALEQHASAFIKGLAKHYFETRDMAAFEHYLEERTSWIGSGQDEMAQGLDQTGHILGRDTAEYSGRFSIAKLDCTVVPLTHPACVSYGAVIAVPEDEALAQEDIRFTAVTEHGPAGDRLLHLHSSHPDILQELGRSHLPRNAASDHRSLRSALNANVRLLENLTKHIPGGMHQRANDASLTLLSMSDGFLSMFGYTREEITTLFRDQFIEMVYPDDRTSLLRSVHQQIQQGPDMELEYRVLHKSGQPVWILDKGRLLEDGAGNPCFYCLLVEINDRKQQQQALRLSLERHQVIMDQATDIIFEWDIRQDTLQFSQNWRKKFGYDAINKRISGTIPLSENIHPEDMPAFLKLMQDTAAGVPYSETEFRIRNLTGSYLWCRIRATAQYDGDRRPIKAVGVIVDIDSEKRQKQLLLDQAQRDMLTGLYNKATITTLVEQQLAAGSPGGLHALLIVDVDHFKRVNDSLGHLCGDSVLSDVAATIKSRLAENHLAGRIGGDEFMIFLPEVTAPRAATEFTRTLLEALHLLTPEAGTPPITCSIGVAVCDHAQRDLNVLFKQADMALYHRKKNGRQGATLYDPLICAGELHERPHTAMDAPTDQITSGDQMAQYAFRTLYRAQDIASAIQRLLEIFGRAYNVSRAYIFEETPDGRACCNTFEWCAEGIAPERQHLQYVPYNTIPNHRASFDESGIFFCPDIQDTPDSARALLTSQGICSVLQCAMMDQGRFAGYIGFDTCRDQRVWTRPQLASFKLTADVVSTFLQKLRQRQRLDQDRREGTPG